MNSHREIKLAASYNWFHTSSYELCDSWCFYPLQQFVYFQFQQSLINGVNIKRRGKQFSKYKTIGERILATQPCSHPHFGVVFLKVEVSEEHSPVPVCSHCSQQRLPIALWQSRTGPGLSAGDSPELVTWLRGFLHFHLGTTCTQTLLFSLTLSTGIFLLAFQGTSQLLEGLYKRDPHKLPE